MELLRDIQLTTLVIIAVVVLLFVIAVMIHLIMAIARDRARIANDDEDHAIGLQKTDWEISLEDQYKGEEVVKYIDSIEATDRRNELEQAAQETSDGLEQ